MSPRILDVDYCPHCKAKLPKPTPRACLECGGSLQKRHLSIGCLTSAPPVILVGFVAWQIVAALRDALSR
jgi:predicted amidophosphoribosyltransferase